MDNLFLVALPHSNSGPKLCESDRLLLVPDPPGDTPRLAECQVVHVDDDSGRLIVTWSEANGPLIAAVEAPLLVLIARPGEPVFLRGCIVEAWLERARWLVLHGTAPWQRLRRRLVERTVVQLPAEGHRYMKGGGGLTVRGTIQNMSMTGFLFESDAHVGLGDLVVLHVPLPDGEVLRIRGHAVRVVRSPTDPEHVWHIGCQFWGVPVADQEQIARFLKGRLGP